MPQFPVLRRPRLIFILPLVLFFFWFWVTSLFSSSPPSMASSTTPDSTPTETQTSNENPFANLPPVNASEELVYESLPCIRIYKSGRVERYFGSEFTPATTDPVTDVTSKDVVIDSSTGIGARLYLPKSSDQLGKTKIPILVYYHGGGFCLGSAFNPMFHNYFNSFVKLSNVLVVSIEYRLAPEYPVPVQYEDSWSALQWIVAHSDSTGQESWINDHADFSKLYLGGESAGANIAHHLAMKVGKEGLEKEVKINGLALIHPYFLGTNKVESESIDPTTSESLASLWKIVCPTTIGVDDPLINPFVTGAPRLDGLACGRVLICVGGKDTLRDRGKMYYEKLKDSGWKGKAEIREVPGVGHTFHLLNPTSEEAIQQDRVISTFLNH